MQSDGHRVSRHSGSPGSGHGALLLHNPSSQLQILQPSFHVLQPSGAPSHTFSVVKGEAEEKPMPTRAVAAAAVARKRWMNIL
eukprot:CAMPEP_0171016940 /NCGR_PEP_ID=MMETSP0736-20130129/27092_1 /TAXON_ID=186038 /ORGANISM="Fragilariopsis kerguelensis, Strain L26-C5" /LENGTH=82 /DNA_ID=CAMNT_0011452593 /DNA_START=509 /DNA_END=754 /DNA_ORIENTATION=+